MRLLSGLADSRICSFRWHNGYVWCKRTPIRRKNILCTFRGSVRLLPSSREVGVLPWAYGQGSLCTWIFVRSALRRFWKRLLCNYSGVRCFLKWLLCQCGQNYSVPWDSFLTQMLTQVSIFSLQKGDCCYLQIRLTWIISTKIDIVNAHEMAKNAVSIYERTHFQGITAMENTARNWVSC